MADLTPEEQKAIRALKRLEKIWPDTLWLFSAGGDLHVMRNNDDGETAFIGNAIDPDCSVVSIDIPNSGGDW